jgi:hypothetical protein
MGHEGSSHMRRLIVAMISLGFLAVEARALPAAEVLASRGDVAAPLIQAPGPAARPSAEPQGTSVATQELVTGALVVGGAFVIGLVAGGTLASAIVSAGTVVVIYGLLP